MDEKVQHKLNQLLVLYQQKLPEKLAEIKNLWQELLHEWNKEKLQTLHREIHSLCGSSGTYGYTDLSQIARNAEIFFKKLLPAEHINERVLHQGSAYIHELLEYSLSHKQNSETIFETESKLENLRVFILEHHKKIQQQLIHNLRSMGFSPFVLQDIITLELAIKEKPPLAIIINSDFLDEYSIQFLKHREHQEVPIQLFCTIPNTELI